MDNRTQKKKMEQPSKSSPRPRAKDFTRMLPRYIRETPETRTPKPCFMTYLKVIYDGKRPANRRRQMKPGVLRSGITRPDSDFRVPTFTPTAETQAGACLVNLRLPSSRLPACLGGWVLRGSPPLLEVVSRIPRLQVPFRSPPPPSLGHFHLSLIPLPGGSRQLS